MKYSLPVITNLSEFKSYFSGKKGFTLVELLVVIAVLGVLAAGVLIAINPIEQLRRGRDSGRKTSVAELGRSLTAYYTSQTTYPTQGTTWITLLRSSGEIKIEAQNPNYSNGYTPACGGAAALQNGYCYATGNISNNPEALVFVQAESESDRIKAGCTTSTMAAWIVWSSAAGKTGLTCTANATTYPQLGISSLN